MIAKKPKPDHVVDQYETERRTQLRIGIGLLILTVGTLVMLFAEAL